MPDKLRAALQHLLLSALLCAGLTVPALRLLLPGAALLSPLLAASALLLVLFAASLHRRASIAAAVLLPLALLIWALQPGSMLRLSDVAMALTLRFDGQRAALPLVAGDAALLLGLLSALLCWIVTLQGASALPSVLLCTGAVLLLFLTGASGLLPWLLPAFLSAFLQLVLDRHPRTSLPRLLPLAALLILLAFLLTPPGGVTFAPLKEQADNLRQMILDRLFYTEPRDVFSLAVEGFYPQGSGQLGGRPELSDRPVMQVSAPRTVYLRGIVLNDYTGHAWRNTLGGRRHLWQSPRQAALRASLFDESLPAAAVSGSLADPMTVSVRMLSSGASTLFVPQRVRSLSPGGGLVPYFSDASELFATRNLQGGDTWSVAAPLFRSGDPGISTLVEAASGVPDPAFRSIQDTWTRLPSHLEQPVYDLADSIVASAASPYDRAFAIQSWLSRNCRYTLDVEDHPADRDFVTRFLLETRQGYCTYFASAMTVLCRMAGLPARYVEGYLAEPDATGQTLVTSRDGHAWTEVYFSGFGWLTFDATPGHTGGQDPALPDQDPPGEEESPDGENPEDEPPDEENPDEENPDEDPPEDEDQAQEEPTEAPPEEDPPEDEPTPEPPERQPDKPPAPFPLWLVLLLALLLLLAALALRFRFTRPAFLDRRARNDGARLDVWAQALFDALAADGLTRRRGETLLDFFRRADASARYAVTLEPAGECLSVLRYSTAQPAPGDADLLRDLTRRLCAELRLPARLALLARQLFVPLSRRRTA